MFKPGSVFGSDEKKPFIYNDVTQGAAREIELLLMLYMMRKSCDLKENWFGPVSRLL